MGEITWEYKKDESWRNPHKYIISFNDGLKECGWWVTVLDKKDVCKYSNFFDLRIGVDVAYSSVYTTHKVKSAGLPHEEVVKLMTKGLTREMAFQLTGPNRPIFNLDMIATNALYNYLRDVKGLSGEEMIMTGEEVHSEFLKRGIIEKLELADETLTKLGERWLGWLWNCLPREEFDRLFSNAFILKHYDFDAYSICKFYGRGLEEAAMKKIIAEDDSPGDMVRTLRDIYGGNKKNVEMIERAQMEVLISQ